MAFHTLNPLHHSSVQDLQQYVLRRLQESDIQAWRKLTPVETRTISKMMKERPSAASMRAVDVFFDKLDQETSELVRRNGQAVQARDAAFLDDVATGSGYFVPLSVKHNMGGIKNKGKGIFNTNMKKGGAFEFPSQWLQDTAASVARTAAPVAKNIARNVVRDASTSLLEQLLARFGPQQQEEEMRPAPRKVRLNRRAPAPALSGMTYKGRGVSGGSQASSYVAKLAATGNLEPGHIQDPSDDIARLAEEQDAGRVVLAPKPQPVASRLRQRKKKGGFLPLLLAPLLLKALRPAGSGLPAEADASAPCSCKQKRKRAPAKEGDKRLVRAALVRKIMEEQGLSLPMASKYVKDNGLF